MLPASTRIISCPGCQQLFRRGGHDWSMASAVLWSDGHIEGPWWPPQEDLAGKCPTCGTFFVADAFEIRNHELSDSQQSSIRFFRQEISLDEIAGILGDTSLLTSLASQRNLLRKKGRILRGNDVTEEDIMRYLKIDVLMKLNDIIRQGGRRTVDQQKLFCQFASDVVADQNEQDDWAIIQKAELCRNLGRFKETFRLLAKVSDPELRAQKQRIFWASVWRRRSLIKVRTFPKNYSM